MDSSFDDSASLEAPTVSPDGALVCAPRAGEHEMSRDEATLLAVVATLVAIGLVMVYSTSSVRWDLKLGDATYFLRKQALWTALAGLSFVLVWQTDAAWLRRFAPWIMGATLVVLALVLIPGIGTEVRGQRRWIRLMGLSCQPSEVAKYSTILFAAAFAARPGAPVRDFWRGFVPGFGVVCLASGLVAVETDLGTAAFIGAVGTVVLVVGGMRLLHLLPIASPLAIGAAFYAATKLDHVRDRLLAFLDPESAAQGAAYQVRQSLLALGSGGPLGQGLGESRQKWLFLPDEHTDFILAILGEELGFLGTALVVALYLGLLVYGARLMARSQDRFSFLVIFGVTFAIGMQACMNIAVVTSSMPTKGISLPFVSFGGSSLIASAIGVGLILSVARSQASLGTAADAQEELA